MEFSLCWQLALRYVIRRIGADALACSAALEAERVRVTSKAESSEIER